MTENAQSIIQSLKNNIQKVNQNLSQIEQLNQLIGTPKDSHDIRKKLTTTQGKTKELLEATQKSFKELHGISGSQNSELKIQKERIADELVRIVNKFQTSTQLSLQKQKTYELPSQNNDSQSNFEANDNERAFKYNPYDDEIVRETRQVQLKENDQLNLVQDRQKDFKRLENDIVDLNSMMKDLAIIVHEQGEAIDTIENNIQQTELVIENTNSQLSTALKSQSSARRKKICIIITIIVVIIVLILVLVLSLQPWKK